MPLSTEVVQAIVRFLSRQLLSDLEFCWHHKENIVHLWVCADYFSSQCELKILNFWPITGQENEKLTIAFALAQKLSDLLLQITQHPCKIFIFACFEMIIGVEIVWRRFSSSKLHATISNTMALVCWHFAIFFAWNRNKEASLCLQLQISCNYFLWIMFWDALKFIFNKVQAYDLWLTVGFRFNLSKDVPMNWMLTLLT